MRYVFYVCDVYLCGLLFVCGTSNKYESNNSYTPWCHIYLRAARKKKKNNLRRKLWWKNHHQHHHQTSSTWETREPKETSSTWETKEPKSDAPGIRYFTFQGFGYCQPSDGYEKQFVSKPGTPQNCAKHCENNDNQYGKSLAGIEYYKAKPSWGRYDDTATASWMSMSTMRLVVSRRWRRIVWVRLYVTRTTVTWR